MNCPTNKKKGVSCTKTMRFHPFVSTGNAPRKGTRGVPAGLVEAIPLNKIKYNEQRDKETDYGYIGPLGGRYQNYYKYDPLHRLTRAGGSNQYGFEQAFELSRAGRPLSMSTNGKVKHYAYGEHTPPHAPQRIMVEEGFRHTLHDLRWDPAGNLGQVSTLAHDMGDIRSRFLFWTEDSRLHTVVDDRHHSYYAYDHAGGSCGSRAQSQACLSYAEMQQRRQSQRTLKVTGHSHQLDVNADLMHTAAGLDEFTLYPSPYLVFTNRGYTKHYYAGSERLAARIGGGFDRPILHEQTDIAMTATHLFKQSQHHTNERHLNAPPAHTIRRDHLPENIYMAMTREFEAPMHLEANVVIKSNDLIRTAQNIVSGSAEPEVYFYHSDHLGSASWITDSIGIPIQHLQYLPYGEPFVNQRVSGYNERFTFTGKERDEETGYSYFSARYLDHEILTSFLSVDRYADKYPSISPYAYCAWNPIILTDPSGDTIINKYLQYKDSKGYYGELYVRTQQLIDEFQTSHPEEFDYLNNISYESENGECTPINIFIGVSDEKGPKNPSTGTRADGHTVYQFNYNPVDCYDEKGRYTQRLDVVGIKDNKFSITLYKHHHNIATLANEFGDVIFGVLRSQTVHDQRNLGYYKKATTIFSFDYEEFIMDKRATCPNPFDEKEYR